MSGPLDHDCSVCRRPHASYGLTGARNLTAWFCAACLPPAWMSAAPMIPRPTAAAAALAAQSEKGK